MRLFQNASYRFIQARRKAYVVSGIILVTGIGFMTFNVTVSYTHLTLPTKA